MADYIEKVAFLDAIERMKPYHQEADDIAEMLQNFPAADVQPVVRGEWGYRWKIHGDGRRPTELFPCTVCGFENTSATNFCPNCGADMRGGTDDE